MRALFLILFAQVVIAQPFRTVTTDNDGTVVRPSNFWVQNSNGVNSVVSATGGGVTSAELLSATNLAAINSTNAFYPSNNPAGFAPSNALGSAAYEAAGSFQSPLTFTYPLDRLFNTVSSSALTNNDSRLGTAAYSNALVFAFSTNGFATNLTQYINQNTTNKIVNNSLRFVRSDNTLMMEMNNSTFTIKSPVIDDGQAIQNLDASALAISTVPLARLSGVVTQGNSFVQVFSNAVNIDATHALSVSNSTASRMAMIGADRTLTNSGASGAVPINADGTATTFAQMNTLAGGLTNNLVTAAVTNGLPGIAITNGLVTTNDLRNLFLGGITTHSNAVKVDAAHSLSVSNATASRMAMIGADLTLTNSGASGAVPINADGTATTAGQIPSLSATYLLLAATNSVVFTNDARLKVFTGGTVEAFASISNNATAVGSGLTNIFEVKATNSAGLPAALAVGTNGTATIGKSLMIPSNNIVCVTDASVSSGGALGEYTNILKAAASAQALTTAVPTNIIVVTLAAGDWDVQAVANFGGTAPTNFSASISITTNTPLIDGAEGYFNVNTAVATGQMTNHITLTRKRINVSTATPVYLVGKATFSGGAVAAFGSVTARRVR